eukprot:12901383-Prorocentrum_lima.AAC.1
MIGNSLRTYNFLVRQSEHTTVNGPLQHPWMLKTRSHETIAGPGETHSQESSGSHQEQEDDS